MESNYIAEHIRCTEKEKYLCIRTVKRIMELTNIARTQGILALENEIEENGESDLPLLKIGIALVVDGTDPEIVETILKNYLLSSEFTNQEFLENMLVYQGVLAIQMGENPRMIQEKLYALFGIQFREELKKKMKQGKVSEELTILIERCQRKLESFEKVSLLESLSDSRLDRRSIQRIMREISLPILEFALIGSSRRILELFLENMSKNNQKQFFEDICCMENIQKLTIEDSQKELLEVINRLEKQGEIIDTEKIQMLNQEEINQLLKSSYEASDKSFDSFRKGVRGVSVTFLPLKKEE